MGVEVLLVVEGGAVDPRQLRVLLVAAPVRAGEAGQLQRLDRPRVLQVRAAAEIGEVALRVEGDRALGGVDQLDLVRLVLLLEVALCLLGARPPRGSRSGPRRAPCGSPPRSPRARPRRSAPGTRSRSRSRSRSAGRSRPSCRGRDGGRPRRAGARPSGAGRRARRGLPCRGSSGSGSAGRPRAAAKVLDVAVRAHEDGLLGQLRPDRARRVEAGRAVGKFEFRVVGKDDLHVGRGYFAPREDDRNDELDDSPAPDPERGAGRRGRPRSGLAFSLRPRRRPSARRGT